MEPSATIHAVTTTERSEASGAEQMQAVLQPAYGTPDVLVVAQVERPTVGDHGVLVRVAAASLHKGDWHLLTGTPYLVRLIFGLRRPKQPIMGMAMAGRVVAVGAKVQSFQVGDDVFGEISQGAFAEYVCTTERELAPVPVGLSFEDAAALPVSATTALQGLRDAGKLVAGQSVLINGAAGGVGTYAVQMARALGLQVTAVCSANKTDFVRSLGANDVIDYTRVDFTQGDLRYDTILDLVGNQTQAACRRVLRERGLLVAAAGGAEHRWVGPLIDILRGVLSNLWSRQKFVPLANKPNAGDLTAVAQMVVSGQVRPAIDRRITMGEVADAMRKLGQGHSQGKTVIHIWPAPVAPAV